MPSEPLVSVVIPAYNAARYLGDALDSVFAQTVADLEVIVVDDGSTDHTSGVAKAYPGVRLLRQSNQGASAARNRALELSRGRYIALLDADDLCHPERLERQIHALAEDPMAIGCLTGHWVFDNDRRVIATLPGNPAAGRLDALEYLSSCFAVVGSLLYERPRAVGLSFPEGVQSAQDMIFSALLATRGPLVVIPDVLYGYRSHDAQSSIRNRATSQGNPYFECRLRWAQAHWHEHWPERRWEEIESRLWTGFARQTEDAYWARNKRFFLADRDYIRRRWPAHLARPIVGRWRWYPDWLWSAKSWLDRLRKR